LKKILLVAGIIVALSGIVGLTIVRARAGYTKVLIGTVKRENLVSVVSATGQVTPKTYVNVGANAMGRVTHLFVKEGEKVKKGQILATIENQQQKANVAGQEAAIAAARTNINSFIAAQNTQKANVEHALADLQQKKLDYIRARALLKDQVMSKQNYDSAKAAYQLDVASVAQARAQFAQAVAQTAQARAQLRTQEANLKVNEDLLSRTVALAPFNGIVTNLPIRQGEMVVQGIQNAEGSTLMTLADMSVITAEVYVDETDIVNVAVGQQAQVTVDALPGKIFKGTVTEVGDQALLQSTGVATSQSTSGVEQAKDFKVVITLKDPSKELRPGLSCTANIITAQQNNTVSIPIQALVLRDPKTLKEGAHARNVSAASSNPLAPSPDVQGVFVVNRVDGKQRVHFVQVTTGITGTTDIQVLKGLKPGDRIVTGTYKVLRDMKEGELVQEDKALENPKDKSDSSDN
jgi:HlyD family secretion protein